PWLVDVVAAIVSIASLTLFLKFWQPKKIWSSVVTESASEARPSGRATQPTRALSNGRASDTLRVWLPWIILSVVVFIWGLPQTKSFLDGISAPKIPVYYLD